MQRRFKLGALTAALVVAVVGTAFAVGEAPSGDGGDYALKVSMPNAAGLVDGSPVKIDGFEVGTISTIAVQEDRALLEVDFDSTARVPLHTGTKVRVEWEALVGERIVQVLPGPTENPTIPSGSVIEAGMEQVEVDQILNALDPKTRRHLRSTVQQLDATLKSRPEDLKRTVESAGPAVEAMGQVLKGLGEDGPAIRSLVTDLRKLTAPLAERQQRLGHAVNETSELVGTVARQEKQLREALAELPSTLDAAKRTLDRVPSAVDETAPLLADVRPAAERLTSVSKNLSPLLVDLRPAMAELRPTLASASSLLKRTPTLLDSAHAVVPGVTDAVTKLNPAVDFLRPYAPDLVGWVSNWGNAFAGYDSRGHFFHGLVQIGTGSFDDNPGVSVGMNTDTSPPPGFASGEPWHDANGDRMR